MGLFNFFNKEQKGKKTIAAEEISRLLEAAGYFKYAEISDIPQLKEELGKEIATRDYFPLIVNEHSPYNIKDPRHFMLDGEELFEIGGVLNTLKDMQGFFEKINVKMLVTDVLEDAEPGDGGYHCQVTLNTKRYILFEKFKGYGWGEAAQRFTDMINDQLQCQSAEERLYLVAGGNDGRAVFLTNEQFEILDTLIENFVEKPLKTQDWCRFHEVSYVSVC